MSGEPLFEHDPDDPLEILRVLPERHRLPFLGEYHAAAREAAREPGGYHRLLALLRTWRLRAVAYSDPEFEDREQRVRQGVRAGQAFTPASEVFPAGLRERFR